MKQHPVGSYKWIIGLNNQDYKAFISHLIVKSQEIYELENLNKNQNDKFIYDTLVFFQSLNDIDIDTTSRRVRSLITSMLGNQLHFLNWLAAQIYTAPPVREVEDALNALQVRAKDAVELATTNRKEAVVDLFAGLVLPTSFQNSPTIVLEKNTPFSSVNSLLESLSVSLQQAVIAQKSAEDEHFLTQLMNEYLPSIISSSANSGLLSDALKQDMEKQFLIQLEAISSKLEKIVADANQKTMEDVRAQTEFLREIAHTEQKALA